MDVDLAHPARCLCSPCAGSGIAQAHIAALQAEVDDLRQQLTDTRRELRHAEARADELTALLDEPHWHDDDLEEAA